ncbi:hypothetical protein ACFY04_36315 [Streptomyces sp. NPDC001549]|uniref:hypothetical protein n=1 Tax=Streptomyces sp. NPDC001549 TaxID=3364586 RepID=UPI00368E0120
MTDCVKHLPTGAIPQGMVAAWGVDTAPRRLRARVPAVFAPAAGSLLLAGPVLLEEERRRERARKRAESESRSSDSSTGGGCGGGGCGGGCGGCG